MYKKNENIKKWEMKTEWYGEEDEEVEEEVPTPWTPKMFYWSVCWFEYTYLTN